MFALSSPFHLSSLVQFLQTQCGSQDQGGGRIWKITSSRVRTSSSGFHAAGDVDSVSKETVPRHRESNHSADHRAAVYATTYHQLVVRTMWNLRAPAPEQNVRAKITMLHLARLMCPDVIQQRCLARYMPTLVFFSLSN